MPIPSAFVLHPYLWTTVTAVLLVLLGAAVGQLNGRLVGLFGPARTPRPPGPRGALAARRDRPLPAEHEDDAATLPADAEDGSGEGAGGGPGEGAGGGPGEGAEDGPGERPPPEEDDEGPPPPRCPHCRAELRFLRWLPVVEARAFRKRGACPHCEQVIRSDPAVVVTTALLFGAVGLWALARPHWCPFDLPAVLWLVAVGVLLSVIDLRVMRLPDAVVAPAYPVAAALVGAAVLLPPGGPEADRFVEALACMALVTVLYWLLWRVHRTGLGFGDVKLSGLTGLYAGWAAGPLGALVAVFWAFAAFSLVGLLLMALRRLTRRDPLPLGPFMLAAALATVLAGGPLLPQP
ncbi:peptidase [Nocardiopsis sp. TSRI0078]|uniref:prepilin peptidase n=1 Tax=unclassified Nocardiopsis TaxID=2649073 RepID=UPI00093D3F3F|nr:A24 family peptidase [Nocardiopsis sp. TSRI0078]OKI18731.1 peptidase [Nocardiopsis sp. TSRI0078]